MMDLLPLSNLKPAVFEGTPSALPPDLSSEEFYSFLLNQPVNIGEGLGNGNDKGCQGTVPAPLSEESLFPRSNEEDSFPSDTFSPLFTVALIDPLNVSILPEGQETPPSLPQPPETPLVMPDPLHFPIAVGADLHGDPSLSSEKIEGIRVPFIHSQMEGLDRLTSTPSDSLPADPFNLTFQELSISQNLEGESTDRSLIQSGSEKTSSDISLLKKDVSETDQGVVNRMNIQREEPSSLFQIKGKDVGNPLIARKIQDSQRTSTSFNPTPVPSEKDGMDLILKFEFIGEPPLGESNFGSGPINHRSVFLKNDPSLSEPFSIQNGVGMESKMEHVITEESQKAQNGFSPKTESFEIYHQVGRKMAWSVQHGEERIKLTLAPPHLGNLYMEVTREKEMVKATLLAENPAAKELLETHRGEIRRILEVDGFKLERFDVFVQQETDRFMERRGFSFLGGQREHGEIKEGKASLSPELSEVRPMEGRRFPGDSSFIDRIV